MLNSSGRSGHAFIVPDLRGKALSFKIMMLAVDFYFFLDPLYETEDSIFSVLKFVGFFFLSQMGVEFCQMPPFPEF